MANLIEQLNADFDKWFYDRDHVFKVIFPSFTYRADGDPMPYDPAGYLTGKRNQAQDEFHTAAREGKRYLAYFGGSGGGKSMSAAREAILHLFKPNSTVWFVGADYDGASKEFDYAWNDLVLATNEDGEREWEGVIDRAVNNPNNGDMEISFKWGSKLVCKSAKNADDGSLLGEGIDCIVLCEGSRIPGGIFKKYLERAISRRKGRVICNTTPRGKNWVYRKFFTAAMVDKNPLYWSAEPFPATVNPYYDRAEYDRQKEEMGEDSIEFQEQFMGLFVSYSGLCYPEFKVYGDDKHVHKVDPRKDIPESWPRWFVVDPHLSIPHAAGFYTVDRNNCPIIYDELWVSGSAEDVRDAYVAKVEEHGGKIEYGEPIRLPDGRQAREVIALHGGQPIFQIIDTSAETKSDLHGGTSFLDEFRAVGLRFKKAKKEGIYARTLALKRNLKERVPIMGKEDETKPWLTCARHCSWHIHGFEHMEWEEYSSRTEKTAKQDRKDRDDHHINCVEYFLAEKPTWDAHRGREMFRPSKLHKPTTIERAAVSNHVNRLKDRPWRVKAGV